MSHTRTSDVETARALASMRLARAGAAICVAVGVVVAAGWTFGTRAPASVLPGLVSMKMNTALCVAGAGAALYLLVRPSSRAALRAGVTLALLVAALAAANLAEDLFGLNLGIDQLLVRDPGDGGTVAPGRMAVATSLGLLCVGLAVATLGWRRERCTWTRTAAAAVAHLVAVAALLGYASGFASLYRVPGFSSIALPTAASIAVLSAAVVLARPDRGLAQIVVAESEGGRIARRLLPAIPVSLAVLGGATLVGARLGWYDGKFAVVLMTLVGGLVATAFVARQSADLHRVDRVRRASEDEVRALNETLERRVEERTRELQDALARVRTLEGLVPMCAWCRRVDAGDEKWVSVEDYISGSTKARVTHGLCADCLAKHRGRPFGATR